MKAVIAFCIIAPVFAHDATLVAKFNAWTVKFDKSYDSEAEFEHAFHNFEASLARVTAAKAAGKTYYGLTKFSDLSPAEFKATYLRCDHTHRQAPVITNANEVAQVADVAPPATFDWRKANPNPVTAVKDQGQCGSCWAFSATENIESMNILHGNPHTKLSPEQIVDCDTVDQGCNGGDTPTAFNYVTNAGGMMTETAYPYTAGGGQAGPCQFDPKMVAAKISNFTWAIPVCASSCDKQDITKLRTALSTIGPFAICVYAQPWQDYQGGVFSDASCIHSYPQLDHCVQMVGYDWNKGYWIIRNSWGTNWGESGYIYIDNKPAGGNLCGVADEVNYANSK